MLLALIVWVGGLIFFPVLAGTAFSVLPSPHLAGLVVRRSLIILHWMGIVSGIVFLVTSTLMPGHLGVFGAPLAGVADAGADLHLAVRDHSSYGQIARGAWRCRFRRHQ